MREFLLLKGFRKEVRLAVRRIRTPARRIEAAATRPDCLGEQGVACCGDGGTQKLRYVDQIRSLTDCSRLN